jgi:hypothetical protein
MSGKTSWSVDATKLYIKAVTVPIPTRVSMFATPYLMYLVIAIMYFRQITVSMTEAAMGKNPFMR